MLFKLVVHPVTTDFEFKQSAIHVTSLGGGMGGAGGCTGCLSTPLSSGKGTVLYMVETQMTQPQHPLATLHHRLLPRTVYKLTSTKIS